MILHADLTKVETERRFIAHVIENLNFRARDPAEVSP